MEEGGAQEDQKKKQRHEVAKSQGERWERGQASKPGRIRNTEVQSHRKQKRQRPVSSRQVEAGSCKEEE